MKTALVCIVFFLSAACDRRDESEITNSPSSSSVADSSVIASPEGLSGNNSPSIPIASIPIQKKHIPLSESYSLPGLSSVERSSSWDRRLEKFSADDREYLNAVNQSYFGSLAFYSDGEQESLVAKGFPMPEEWIAASTMSDSELLRLSQEGNLKAQIFYIDRVMSEFAPKLKSGGLDSHSKKGVDDILKLNAAKMMALGRVAETRSPFSAYQAGLFLQQTSHGQDPSMAAGAFQLARELGDERANGLGQIYSNNHSDINGMAAMSSYSMIKSGLSDH